MRQHILYTVGILVLVSGCGGSSERQRTPIPNDVTYTIIEKYVLPGIKRSLAVRLNRKVTQDVLRSIAVDLKNSDPNTYERTFISYYLPDMKVDAGAWATTHFNPDLEVRILGLTVEQEQSFKTEANDPSREVIGSWLDERPSMGNKTTIFSKDGKLFMENKYTDGSVGETELVEKASPRGRRLDDKNDRHGEYYLINNEGNLQGWGKDGPFFTARKIK